MGISLYVNALGLVACIVPIWLRERSFDATNKDPATGHRLQEAAFLPLDLTLEGTELLPSSRQKVLRRRLSR